MTTDPLKLARFAPQAHGLLRIATALTFLSHGTAKLLGVPHLAAMPSPPLLSLFGIAGVIEIVGGLLVLVGLFTRIAAFILAGEMAVAYWMVHAKQGLIPLVNMGESAYLFCFVFLFLAAAGPGAFAIERETSSR